MISRSLLAIGLCLLASACATNPNAISFEGVSMNSEVLEVGPGKYKLTIEGHVRQDKAQVERAYAFRAGQLCEGRTFAHDAKAVPYQLGTPGGFLMPAPPVGYRVIGVATCSGMPTAKAGMVAVFRDSANAFSEKRADLFYLSEVNGEKIEDSRMRTERLNRDRGMYMTPMLVERNVPARAASFTIVGRAQYAAPILAIVKMGRIQDVTGIVKFSPEPHKTYVVKGQLGENQSAVWIEEVVEGGPWKRVGEKIEQRAETR
jgi:hypothetical protein